MEENVNMKEVVEEIKEADEENLKQIMEDWFKSTRADGIKLGAKMISVVVADTIAKHTRKAGKVSLNDYKRMTADIMKIISVQLTDQKENITEENVNDGAAEEPNESNSGNDTE